MSEHARVFLRQPKYEDVDPLIRAYARSQSLHEPWTYPPNDMFSYILEPYRYLLCLTSDEKVIGTFNLSGVIMGNFKSAYLGYEVFAPFQQQGFMKEGLQLIIREAFHTLQLHRLEANIQPGNAASIRLVEQAGFVKEGYSKNYLNIGGKGWKDHERWALLNEN